MKTIDEYDKDKRIPAAAVFSFPQMAFCCNMCPLLETYSRHMCRLTGELLPDTKTIGYLCPLILDKDKLSKIKEIIDE